MRFGLGPFLDGIFNAWSVENALQRITAAITVGWEKQHKPDGTHGNVTISNTEAGETASVLVTADTATVGLYAIPTDFTSSGAEVADGAVLYSDGSGGLSIDARDASGELRLYATGSQAHCTMGDNAATFHTPDVGAAVVINTASSQQSITINSRANGTGAKTGNAVSIGCNTSGSGAAGYLNLVTAAGTGYFLWVDTSGVLRIGTAPPQEDGTPSDTSGTVVGTQT